MNTPAPSTPVPSPTPSTEAAAPNAEKTIAQQFLVTARMLRTAATDPDTAIAAANWEKRLTAFLQDLPLAA